MPFIRTDIFAIFCYLAFCTDMPLPIYLYHHPSLCSNYLARPLRRLQNLNVRSSDTTLRSEKSTLSPQSERLTTQLALQTFVAILGVGRGPL